jgi:hypothetical protein
VVVVGVARLGEMDGQRPVAELVEQNLAPAVPINGGEGTGWVVHVEPPATEQRHCCGEFGLVNAVIRAAVHDFKHGVQFKVPLEVHEQRPEFGPFHKVRPQA